MKTITKADIKRAFHSTRNLQPGSYQDWENDPEAKLIYAVRDIEIDVWPRHSGRPRFSWIADELYDKLWKKEYDQLPEIPH